MEVEQTSTDEVHPTGSANGGWLFPIFLGVLLLIAILFAQKSTKKDISEAASNSQLTWTPSDSVQGPSASLEIDFGNGAIQKFKALPWHAGMTVADLMRSATEFKPGITFQQKGQGENGFLTVLQAVSNEGISGRNWKYQVDGKHGQTSFCLQQLSAGQHVLWKYDLEE